MVQEDSPSTQQLSQLAASGTSRVDEEKKDDNVVDSLEPTYLYDAMREKRQLRPLLDGQQQDAEEFLCLYLDELDEELPVLLPPISGRQYASAALEAEERVVSQSGRIEVGGQGFLANLVESPITRIFGGKFRSPVLAPNQPALSLQKAGDHSISTSSLIRSSLFKTPSCASPICFVLHLNRVRYDATVGGLMKIEKSIQFGPELEIPLPMLNTSLFGHFRHYEPPHYKLYGVLYHHGESAGSGHYTVDLLHPNGDGGTEEYWLHIDNEAVSPMRHEDVFGEHGAERAAAYLLFYCRTSR
ncbi:hypothetical protein BGY98DRAFT_1179226 [Russula aff. rugulosa BPL654]|nr:hypothetical protein BGY98DRAFT_1179226 [Russula aff. rugulosa BPL654]